MGGPKPQERAGDNTKCFFFRCAGKPFKRALYNSYPRMMCRKHYKTYA